MQLDRGGTSFSVQNRQTTRVLPADSHFHDIVPNQDTLQHHQNYYTPVHIVQKPPFVDYNHNPATAQHPWPEAQPSSQSRQAIALAEPDYEGNSAKQTTRGSDPRNAHGVRLRPVSELRQ